MKQFSIPVNLLRQYCFCPRIPFFMEVLSVDPQKPSWVKQGDEYHKKQKELSKYRKLKRYGLYDAEKLYHCYLRDEETGIHGIADMLIVTDRYVYPVEFKLSTHSSKGQFVQAAAYGVMASKKHNKFFSKGFVLSEKRGNVYSWLYDAKLEDELFKTIKSVKEVLTSCEMPLSSASINKCGQCEYINYCNDRY